MKMSIAEAQVNDVLCLGLREMFFDGSVDKSKYCNGKLHWEL